jgi:hypothetical protein
LDVPESRQIIKSLKILKGRCNMKELRERVESTALKRTKDGKLAHPKFHQTRDICGKFYVWKPANYDINHHVRFIDGLDENSPSVNEDVMMDLVSQESNKPFQEGRALWEILVVPKFHYKHEETDDVEGEDAQLEEKFAILVRISHGIGDGFSFLKLVMRDMAGAGTEEYIPPSKPSRNPWWMKGLIFLYLFFKSPRAFYRQMALKDKNPLHNKDIRLTGQKVHAWSQPVDIEWLKELKKELDCGMNVMFLTTLTSACRKYMKSRFGVHESQIPEEINTIIPVPAPNHPDESLENKFAIIMMPLEMKTPAPLDRCREIEKENRRMSSRPDGYMNLFLMDLVAVFPIWLAKWLIVNNQCTTVISNLPGPKKQISIWGYPLEDTMFWLPNVGSSGISVSYLSYGNKLRFGLALDTGVIKDGKKGAQDLLRWMLQDLKNLAAAVNLPHDDDSMYVKPPTATRSKISPIPAVPLSPVPPPSEKSDKDEVASEDYGYGGEPSDISSTDDMDEEMEELICDEGVMTKGVGNEGEEDPMFSMKVTTTTTPVTGTVMKRRKTKRSCSSSSSVCKIEEGEDIEKVSVNVNVVNCMRNGSECLASR